MRDRTDEQTLCGTTLCRILMQRKPSVFSMHVVIGFPCEVEKKA
ncbi:hypothetical protein J2S64_000885 [Paeniglutamicibacter sulfureus]|uniref:Uncharacterized protein n=1 Tax=Paeniglutamicibacter sulfureus TaxID=43666 RepID=A0ABU2BGV5_9MICC|nr:hypothetical protein [Paeniglutamicibacter sulfureus]